MLPAASSRFFSFKQWHSDGLWMTARPSAASALNQYILHAPENSRLARLPADVRPTILEYVISSRLTSTVMRWKETKHFKLRSPADSFLTMDFLDDFRMVRLDETHILAMSEGLQYFNVYNVETMEESTWRPDQIDSRANWSKCILIPLRHSNRLLILKKPDEKDAQHRHEVEVWDLVQRVSLVKFPVSLPSRIMLGAVAPWNPELVLFCDETAKKVMSLDLAARKLVDEKVLSLPPGLPGIAPMPNMMSAKLKAFEIEPLDGGAVARLVCLTRDNLALVWDYDTQQPVFVEKCSYIHDPVYRVTHNFKSTTSIARNESHLIRNLPGNIRNTATQRPRGQLLLFTEAQWTGEVHIRPVSIRSGGPNAECDGSNEDGCLHVKRLHGHLQITLIGKACGQMGSLRANSEKGHTLYACLGSVYQPDGAPMEQDDRAVRVYDMHSPLFREQVPSAFDSMPRDQLPSRILSQAGSLLLASGPSTAANKHTPSLRMYNAFTKQLLSELPPPEAGLAFGRAYLLLSAKGLVLVASEGSDNDAMDVLFAKRRIYQFLQYNPNE